MRRSLKHKRDPDAFQQAQEELIELHKHESEGDIDIFYFDEMGASLTPSVPYGWQQKGQRILLPSVRSENQTVLGFVNKQLDSQFFLFKGAANSKVAVHCFDAFAESLDKKTFVVLDNATIHTSKLFMDNQERWEKKGLFLFFIPPYCPELNLIERLWKEVKYSWLKPQFINDLETLQKQLIQILTSIGTEFTVSFV